MAIFLEGGRILMKVIGVVPAFFILFITITPLLANQAQDFSFVDINGKTFSWPDMKGKPVVVNIGSHW
jgi:cytochrome oxidase Cu insertion factor (SCO1/SenC/PrrC family)